MGLLSRFAKNASSKFAKEPAQNRWDNWSLGDYAGMPLVRNAPAGGMVGGMGGAVAEGMDGDMDDGLAMKGALALGGAGVAIPYGVMGKRLIMAFAQSLKQQAPQLADEQAIALAEKAAKEQSPVFKRFMQELEASKREGPTDFSNH